MNMPQVKGPIGRQLVWAPNTDEHKESEVEHNTNLESKDSLKMRVGEVMKLLTETAKKKDLFELDEANGMVFTGAVDSWLAVQAFAEIFNEYDGAAQELLCQVDKEGKIFKKTAVPFDSYKANVAVKYVASAQRDSTISFGNWFPNITNLPYLKKLYETVVTDLDLMVGLLLLCQGPGPALPQPEWLCLRVPHRLGRLPSGVSPAPHGVGASLSFNQP